jgi:transcriptional regulator with XRE-family HTH domain
MDVHRMQIDGFDAEGYRKRLRLLRRLRGGMNQTQFAEFLGIPYKQWNHYERGYPISRETQFILHAKLGADFSADWLFWGEVTRLSPETLEKILSDHQEIMRKRAPRRPRAKVRKRIGKIDKSV